jgi:DNA gyrase/topoisomerase IV subunit A
MIKQNSFAGPHGRVEILEGLVRATDEMDKVNATVSRCKDRADARDALMTMGYTEVQANHVLDLTVSRLTQEGRSYLVTELEDIRSHREELAEET